MISLDEFIIRVYCEVQTYWQAMSLPHRRGFAPALTDGEVLTLEIVDEFLGYDTNNMTPTKGSGITFVATGKVGFLT
nr:hypothetical protein [Candidatus Cyanaurora vandensis]